MSDTPFNTVTWFQVGTDAPEAARAFYGDMFGWTFTLDPDADGYDLIHYAGSEAPNGGVQHTSGGAENHGIFLVMVPDVQAACDQAEKLGGAVRTPRTTNPAGLVYAYLTDPSGNRFGVFTPPQPA